MNLEKRKISGREKDQDSIKLLEKLREQIYSSNPSIARRAAFNLSWMQEDGLEILKEALFTETSKRAKGAAAYGLRKMRGRMKKIALNVLSEGTKHSDRATAEICTNAISVVKHKFPPKVSPAGRDRPARFEIRDLPRRAAQKRWSEKGRGPRRHLSR